MSEVYLDWNAATPPHPEVLSAMREAASYAWANPASVHAAGRRARALVEDTRELLATALGVQARDIVFTSGGTEANNLALRSAPALVTSRLEHPSVVKVAEHLERANKPVAWLPVPESGRLEPADVDAALARLPRGSWVALTAVNHETGVIQPLAEVAEVAARRGAHLHVDAVQALGRLVEPVLVGDSFVVTAHKLRGPKGIGALAFRPGRAPEPLLLGGAQERGLRPGTVDAVAAAGFRAALQRLPESAARYGALAPLRDAFEQALSTHACVNGAGVPRAPHVSNLSATGARGDELVAALDLEGVRVSSGSACSAGTTEPSPVILAMAGKERSLAAVRVSLGEDTSREDVDRAITTFLRVLAGCSSGASSDG